LRVYKKCSTNNTIQGKRSSSIEILKALCQIRGRRRSQKAAQGKNDKMGNAHMCMRLFDDIEIRHREMA